MISLTIDGSEVKVPEGTMVLEAAKAAGIYIPALCAWPGIRREPHCMLCLVEIKGSTGTVLSCDTAAANGMLVTSNSPLIAELRKNAMEAILRQHPHDCLICRRTEKCGRYDICPLDLPRTSRCVRCPKNERCELQQAVEYVGVEQVRLPYRPKNLSGITDQPFFDYDPNLCILCGRCVAVCHDIRGNRAIDFAPDNGQITVSPVKGSSFAASGCRFCGACVDACPTGALMEKSSKWAGSQGRETTTVCPYCGVGCQLILEVKSGKVIRSRPDPAGPSNQGQACVKGKFGIRFVQDRRRLTAPLIRRNGGFEEASWEEALSLVAQRLAGYKGEHFAAIASAKCTNEDNYILQKFTRVVMQTNNIDNSVRLCHAPTLAGLTHSFGSGAMTNSIADIAGAACILAIGTNTSANHPVVLLQIRKAVERGARLIVADPRKVDLCDFATLDIRLRPGTDVALLGGMMKVIVDEGLQDRAFVEERCEGYSALVRSLDQFDIAWASEVTGVSRNRIREAARIYATSKPATIVYAMGVTQHSHGTDNVLAIANLAMLTGNIGKAGAGVNPLRGHNNVQGTCDMGALPDLYPGYQGVADPAARRKFESMWGQELPAAPGLTSSHVPEAIGQGKLKALYIMGENPVLSEPRAGQFAEACSKLEFLVVHDIFLTETAQMADVVLPGVSFAEKDGVFTNTERRVQRVRQVIPPVANSRPEWQTVCEIAKRMGAVGFDFESAGHIMEEIARVVPIYAGISYSRLEDGGLQWPCPGPDHPGTPVLHVGQFAGGKGRFSPLVYRAPGDEPDREYPYLLTTVRSAYQFHTGTLTRKVPGLSRLYARELVEINPADASAEGIRDADWVCVSSRRGTVVAQAHVTGRTPPGLMALTFHFAETLTNSITSAVQDPVSDIAELKVCAARVEKAPAPQVIP